MDLDLKRAGMFAFNISTERENILNHYHSCSKRLCPWKELHYILNCLDK